MRILSIEARDVEPVKEFCVDELSDIVVIAGPNGVGKTRLVESFIQVLRSPQSYPNVKLTIEATTESEVTAWGKHVLDSSSPSDVQKLGTTLHQAKRRGEWQSSVLKFESNRTVQQIGAPQYTWDPPDPSEELIGWNITSEPLKDRWPDTIHSIFRKVHSADSEVARKYRDFQKQNKKRMTVSADDPLSAFKQAFTQLLAPKELIGVDARQNEIIYRYDGRDLPLSALSSGEREVVNIVFDFLLRNAADSIVIFDEPELHLHPELSYRLLQTLRSVGKNNQFIFCTHSAEIITASIQNTVIFLAPPTKPPQNQALLVREDDKTHKALQLLGQSIGVISLGKKIVLIEGSENSLDKQTYNAIRQNQFPDLVLVPAGGKEQIGSFASVTTEILDQTVWGVQFFMLCDRDAVPATKDAKALEKEARGRLKVLSRYHLENYFLDEDVLARALSPLAGGDSWLCDPAAIRDKLQEIARSFVSYAAALIVSAEYRFKVGNLDIMPSGAHNKSGAELAKLMHDQSQAESTRISAIIDPNSIEASVLSTVARLETDLASRGDAWKSTMPGKQILSQFAKAAQLKEDYLKRVYISEALKQPNGPFTEIVGIFEHFSKL